MPRATEKEIVIGEDKYKISLPTLSQSTEADIEYSKAYTRALQEGILPKSSLERLLIKTGAWSPEDEAELEAANLDSQKLMVKIVSEKDRLVKNSFVEEFYQVRDRLTSVASRKQSMLMNSAETKGEEAKLTSLLCKCVTKNGAVLWANKQAMSIDNGIGLIGQLGQELINFMGQLDEKMEELDKLILGDSEELEPEVEEVKEKVTEEVKSEPVQQELL